MYYRSSDGRIRFVRPYHQVTIVGIPGSGKTSFASLLEEYWREQECRGNSCASVYFSYDPLLEEDFWGIVYSVDREKLFVVVDDLTFYFIRYTKSTIQFLQRLMKIRHLSKARCFVVVLCTHYTRGVLPFLRGSGSIIAVSITTLEEMERLSKLFGWSPVRDFYHVYTKTVYNEDRRWGLVNWLGVIFLTEFELLKTKEFDYVVGEADDVRERIKRVVASSDSSGKKR